MDYRLPGTRGSDSTFILYEGRGFQDRGMGGLDLEGFLTRTKGQGRVPLSLVDTDSGCLINLRTGERKPTPGGFDANRFHSVQATNLEQARNFLEEHYGGELTTHLYDN